MEEKNYFLKGGGGINIVFGPKYRPLPIKKESLTIFKIQVLICPRKPIHR
jgi:hypothetical protein